MVHRAVFPVNRSRLTGTEPTGTIANNPAARERMVPGKQRRALGDELRRLRDLAGLSARELGSRIDRSHATVIRIENGQRVPSLPEVRAWVKATGINGETRDRLIELTKAAYDEAREERREKEA
jgi:DNA-binding XRE family transcriptional regulator